jgi:hypothetical protein
LVISMVLSESVPYLVSGTIEEQGLSNEARRNRR